MRWLSLSAALCAAAIFAVSAAAAVPKNTSSPTISGSTRQGETLTASTGNWDNAPTSYSYQWQRCDATGSGCADMSGATSKSYTLGSSDVDHRLRVLVTASNADGQSTAGSRPSSNVSSTGAPTNTAAPTISGTLKVGEELTANPGSWTGGVSSYSYQWEQCNSTGGACHDVVGATARTYGVRSADSGQTLRVAVTARNASGSKRTATSAATDTVQPLGSTPKPAVNHAPTLSFLSLKRVGSKLYARFRVCDDRPGSITVVERDTRTGVLSYTRKYTTYVSSCAAFSRSWTPASRFRVRHGKLVVQLQPVDKSRATGRMAARSLSY